MGIFNKRKINQNAKIQPDFISDGYALPFGDDARVNGTALACIDRIANEFALLNYGIFDVNTKQKVKKHELFAVLKQPNLEDRHYNFFYQSGIDYFHKGCFWLKSLVNGNVCSLFRLDPVQVTLQRDAVTNERQYVYKGNIYTDKQIIYIPSRFDFSTLRGGRSIFDAAKETFETAKSLDSFTQKAFENGVVGKRVVIDVSGAFPDITATQSTNIKNNFQNEYSGVKNAGRPLLKTKGINYTELGNTSSTDNQAAQLKENRDFQEAEIAKIFGVPVEVLKGSISNNLENAFTMFSEFAVRPMATQFQEAICSLLDENKYYFEFDYNGIMKVSMNSRIDAYTKQINNGLLSPNEARARENLEPIEAGDNHFMPANLMPLNDETIEAYMAKQKNEINSVNPTDPDAQHFSGGDDKQ